MGHGIPSCKHPNIAEKLAVIPISYHEKLLSLQPMFPSITCPGCLPAGVGPKCGSEEMVRSPGVLWLANGIADGVGGALPVEPQVRPFVLKVMTPKLAYRRGKREGE